MPNLLQSDLRDHLDLCRGLLAIVEREGQALRHSTGGVGTELIQKKKNLLPSLTQSLYTIRQHRVEWCKRSPRERASHPEVAGLLREIQDVIMKVIFLDRENEQALLRKGLVPAKHLPSANRQRPHFVADLYRRQTDGVAPSESAAGQP
jgi:flagellar biosynthesis/type III secretory pathway chaperone